MEEQYNMIINLNKPDEMFDLICSCNYIAGYYKLNAPIDESRKIFEKIKKIFNSKKINRANLNEIIENILNEIVIKFPEQKGTRLTRLQANAIATDPKIKRLFKEGE